MSDLTVPRKSPARLRKFGAVAATFSVIVWSSIASAALPTEDFSGLAKKVSPAVVYIASTHEVTGANGQAPEMPFQFPPGSPFEKFFKDFRNQMGNNNQPQVMRALGSGFIIDPSGYIVTNNHVVDGASDVKVRLDDESEYEAKVVGTDPLTDLAVLKINADHPLPFVQFGNSDKAEVGNWVLAVGNPFGLGGTVTAGIISARGRNINSGPYDDYLQIDAPINKGNSGGPLFNIDGQVIGVNTAIYSPNGGSVGIGFAIPSNMVKPVVAQLEKSGKVDRGWLGVMIQDVTPEIADALGIEHYGAVVTEVVPDSPAAKAGLKQGDVVQTFNGKKVDGPRDLARIVAQAPAGTKAEVGLVRKGTHEMVAVVTGHLPAPEKMAQAEHDGGSGKSENSTHSDALNADLAALTPDRRAALQIPDNVKGVLVLDIGEGPGFEQGLRPGDIIREVGGKSVTTPKQVVSDIDAQKAKGRKAVLLLVTRQDQNLFLGLKLQVS